MISKFIKWLKRTTKLCKHDWWFDDDCTDSLFLHCKKCGEQAVYVGEVWVQGKRKEHGKKH